jgi:hypothetical protein
MPIRLESFNVIVMKKFIFIYLIFPLAFHSCSENNKHSKTDTNDADFKQPKINPKYSDWTKDNLKGEVKICIDSAYAVLDAPGGPERGRLTGRSVTIYYNNGLKKSYLGEEYVLFPGTEQTNYHYKYDRAGNILEENHNEQVYGLVRNQNAYNDQGELATITRIDSENNLLSKTYLKYNGTGKVSEEKEIGGRGDLYYDDTFIYNDGNKVIERINRHDFSERGIKFKYNDHGYVIAETEFDIMGKDEFMTEEATFTYEYDSHGNWIKRMKFYKSEDKTIPMLMELRSLIYY